MKVLKIIHGYPMRYNAGSEVYSRTLCQALADKHEVQVFTRIEDPFQSDYVMHQELDVNDARVLLNLVNIPGVRYRNRYIHQEVDQQVEKVLDRFQPDVVHIGHLNHLSLTITDVIAARNIPIVYTLHDYWLMCLRGQFIQRNATSAPWALCDEQEDTKCAVHCYAGYFSGHSATHTQEIQTWEKWVTARMQAVKHMTQQVDLFLAPSQFLMQKYIDDFGIDPAKCLYMDYGFDLTRFAQRKRVAGEAFTFGYIGTHIPAKGIQHLLQAFGQLQGDCRLKIWGRWRENSPHLQAIQATLPLDAQARIQWLDEYQNERIVQEVFNDVDAIVVPSIWYENSPLVIHEAQQVGVPVVTANAGGMKEYVHHEVNGLLYKHRDVEDLARQMQRLIDKPDLAQQLGKKRYLYSVTGDIPSIEQQTEELEKLYTQLIARKNGISLPTKPGPWRITFDTNPEDCNLRCVMCEGFSPYSKAQKEKKSRCAPPRRMDIALIRKILEEAQGTPLKEIIPSTMGEPLIYKQFDQIIEMCHTYNLKLNLTTNGTFPIKGAEAWAKLIVPVGSDVKISWNGASKATQEKIMLRTNWEKVLASLKTFISVRDAHYQAGGNRCRVTLQMTFLEDNVHELADVIQLGIDLGVDRIKGHHLWAHFDEIKNLSMRRNEEAIDRWNKAVAKAFEVAHNNLLPNGEQIILENIAFLDKHAVADLAPGGTCPFLNQEAWVNTEGKFSPCCAPDEERDKLGSFGNLYDTSLEEIWKSKAYKNLQKHYVHHPLCISCNMKKPLKKAAI